MPKDHRRYAADAVLRDGRPIRLRAIRPDDKQGIVDLVSRMSAEAVYFRFFRARKRLGEEELRAFTELDFVHDAALVAVLEDDGKERLAGVGRYAALGDRSRPPERAEIAFAVADRYQGRGLGTLLLEHLLTIARANGITRFEADVLGENNRMLRLFATSGFAIERSFAGGVFHVSFATRETEESLAAREGRERLATAASLRGLLHPRAVAVVGASRDREKIGSLILSNLGRGGFTGPVYPVNPGAAEIDGVKAYPRVSAIGKPVDLVVVAVPAALVEGVVADCALAGVRGVVIISAGFGEVSRPGRHAETRLAGLARSAGMRLVGPNCMGLINTDPTVALNATFAPVPPPAGNIGMTSQSGALGIAILDHLTNLNLGVSTFVSMGNRVDVSSNDLLAYWADDPRTEVIVLYLESFGNPRKFARVAPEVARRKPIIAVKSGRSAAGTRAASSHSAALASLDVAADALFEQAGVIRTNTLEELFDVAALLATQPIPPGPRVGVVTNAGGPAILLADACEARGLELPELGPGTIEQLRSFLPAASGFANPIDMVASAGPEEYRRAIELVGADPRVDSLIAIYTPVVESRTPEVARAIAQGAAGVPAEKPVLTVFLSSRGAPASIGSGPRGRLPSFSFPENAALALAAAERHGRWRARPRGKVAELSAFARNAVRAVVDRVLAGAPGPVWLEVADLATVLKAVEVEFAPGEVVPPDPRAAEAAAERLGYPLVAKAVAPGLLHKTDVGGVVLGLKDRSAVGAAARSIAERVAAAGSRLAGLHLQREIPGGLEALAGITSDATFGPLLICGLGGVHVELLKDVSFRLPPVSDLEARGMVAGLKLAKLLDGYRGGPAGDREALARVIERLSLLVEAAPEIQELDLNPIKVLAPGKGAVAVDGRMRVAAVGG